MEARGLPRYAVAKHVRRAGTLGKDARSAGPSVGSSVRLLVLAGVLAASAALRPLAAEPIVKSEAAATASVAPRSAIATDLGEALANIAAGAVAAGLEYVLHPPLPAPTPPIEAPERPAAIDPAPAAPVEAAAASPISPAEVAEALAGAINAQRQSSGLPELGLNAGVSAVAQGRASDMASRGYFAHTSPEGATAFSLLTANGVPYGWAAENIASNNAADAAGFAMAGFMQSGEHVANILGVNYTQFGVGVAVGASGVVYISVVFTG